MPQRFISFFHIVRVNKRHFDEVSRAGAGGRGLQLWRAVFD
jgi:hypothetical protein